MTRNPQSSCEIVAKNLEKFLRKPSAILRTSLKNLSPVRNRKNHRMQNRKKVLTKIGHRLAIGGIIACKIIKGPRQILKKIQLQS
jgi:hypothetical protein